MTNQNERFPLFATNSEKTQETVAAKVNQLFRVARQNFQQPSPIAIATAYINTGGFSLLSEELSQAPHVRILLGAEPTAEVVKAQTLNEADAGRKLSEAESDYEKWLLAERDTTGFTREAVGAAKQLVEWLRAHDEHGKVKVEVRRYTKGFLHGKSYIVDHPALPAVVAGSSNMTYAGLMLNAELNIGTAGPDGASGLVVDWFNNIWEQSEYYDLAGIYSDQWEPHTPMTVFLRMLLELYGDILSEEGKVQTQFDLAGFQVDGILRMERILEELGGVLVADEVGLGKTYLAGEVIKKATDELRQRVLIICPASLKESMWGPFLQKWGFRLTDVMTFEEVRNRIKRDEESFLNITADYAMVVVDEAHNLRNSTTDRAEAVDKVILSGKFPKKVVLLTATPVNNSLMDLDTLIRYFVRDDSKFAALNIPSIKKYIQEAQSMDPLTLSPEHLFDLMDQIAVRRTRKFIKQHYPDDVVRNPQGQMVPIKFPKPRVRRIDYELSPEALHLVDEVLYALDTPDGADAQEQRRARRDDPRRLNMARYTPSAYLKDGQLARFQLANAGLLRSALLKRLESSHYALKNTLETLITSHEFFLAGLEAGRVLKGKALRDWIASESEDLEQYLSEESMDNPDLIDLLSNYHGDVLQADVESDLALLKDLLVKADAAIASSDSKFESLIDELTAIAAEARQKENGDLSATDRRKVIIFSGYADTVIDIYDRLKDRLEHSADGPLADYRGRIPSEPIMGGYKNAHKLGKEGGVDLGGRAAIVEGFAPKTAARLDDNNNPTANDLFDILITTDVLAEGVNLQQAGQMINYDLPWNPMRIVQRHGRIDRLFSDHDEVFLGLFYPAERLDEMLGLEERLNHKLILANAAIGATDVLPGISGGKEVILHDDRQKSVEAFEKLLENRGSSAALSGEEFRRRLYREFERDTQKQKQLERLPLGIGSGFEDPTLSQNVYVFCVRVGHDNQPWFRSVMVDKEWNILSKLDGTPHVSKDTLTSLMLADPGNPNTGRVLEDAMYDKAFDSWKVVKDSVFEEWSKLTDPQNFLPELPAAFRDAQDLILSEGGHLGASVQNDLRARLNSVPTRRVELAVRAALNSSSNSSEKIAAVQEVLTRYGVPRAETPSPLPPVNESEIRLVSWMAVKGTKS